MRWLKTVNRDIAIRNKFLKFLAKTGNKAAHEHLFPSLTSEMIEQAALAAVNNFGKPEVIYGDAKTLEAWKKLNGGK